VPAEQIREGGYNLDIKNPTIIDPGHGDPDELLVEYQKLLGEIRQSRDALKQE
jgi:type I restriction enzyme M protein